MPNEREVTIIYKWKPLASRPKGRPKNRWEDDVRMDLQKMKINHLTPNGHYMGRTVQLTSRCYILYFYSTNIRTEYFKHAA